MQLRHRGAKRSRGRPSAASWAARGIALQLGLAGCAAGACPAPDPLPPVEPAVVAAPPPVPAVPPAVTARLKVDTAAVQRNARQFTAKPSTSNEAVAALEPLTRRVNVALAVLELHRRKEGRYRPADIRSARAAADAVAAFLITQPPPPEPPAEDTNGNEP